MIRKDMRCGAVRWNAFETRVDLVGHLTVAELDEAIATLREARQAREDVGRRRDRPTRGTR